MWSISRARPHVSAAKDAAIVSELSVRVGIVHERERAFYNLLRSDSVRRLLQCSLEGERHNWRQKGCVVGPLELAEGKTRVAQLRRVEEGRR